MDLRRLCLVLFALGASSIAIAAGEKPCVTADQASKMLNKDICISAHVYDVVQLSDGTRFLDICTTETPDERCRFAIVSLWDDHDEVGDLGKFRDRDVRIRGVVRPMHGRSGIILSHRRQFYGGPPKFKPNPRLMRGFNGEQDRPPVSDPNLRPQGGRRAFMNSRDKVPLPSN